MSLSEKRFRFSFIAHGKRCQGENAVASLKKLSGGISISLSSQHSVIPAWSAGIQANMDVSGASLQNLDAGYPCRHDEDLRLYVP
jgi:hypothetical protein